MASPTPSIDSLNGVLAMCDTTDHPIDTYSHVFSGLGSSSGVSSATSSSSSASSLDRASTGSASSTSGQCPLPACLPAQRQSFTFYFTFYTLHMLWQHATVTGLSLLIFWRWRLDIFLSIMIMTYSWHFLPVNEKSGNIGFQLFCFANSMIFYISILFQRKSMDN